MIKKRTLVAKTVDEFAATSAKVCLVARIRHEDESTGDVTIGTRYYYLLDENDPTSEVTLREASLKLTVSDLATKETALGPFTGTNINDKNDDMLLKITDDELDTNTPYGTAASGWENI